MVTLAPRRGDLSPRAHPLGPVRLRPAGRAVGPGPGPVRRRGGVRAEPVRRRGGDVGGQAAHGRRHADRRPAGARALRPRPVRGGVRGGAAHPSPRTSRSTRGSSSRSAGFDVSTRPVRTPMSYETRYLDLETGEIRPEARPATKGHGLDHGLLQALRQLRRRRPRRRSASCEQTAAVRIPLGVAEPQVVAADRATLDRSTWAARRPPPRCWSSSGCGAPGRRTRRSSSASSWRTG